MSYHNNDDDNYQYYTNYNRSDPTNPMRQYTTYNDQGGPSTFTSTVQGLNQSKVDTGYNNNSTRSLGGVTAVEEQQKRSIDEGESRSGSVKSAFTQQPLIGQEFGDVEGQYYYPDYNQNNQYSGYSPKQHHQDDSYYDEEATRHNTLTSVDPNAYNFEHDYTDRDFPGGGKGARQSMTGEHLTIPVKKRRRCCPCCPCCACCSWPICLLITLVILIALGVTAFFVLPRIPTVNIKNATPDSTPIISPNYINLNFTIVVDIENQQNYVPYKFNKIYVSVFDNNAPTVNTPIATGTKFDYTLQPKSDDTLDFPLSVNYTATQNFVNDPVIRDFVAACSPETKNNAPLKLRVEVTLFIWGIDWIYKPTISVPIPDMNCPISASNLGGIHQRNFQ